MKHFRVALVRNAAEHDFGGAERFVVFLATEIDKAGFSAIVLSRHKQLKAFAKSSAVRCYTSPWLSSQNFSGHKVVLFPVYLLWQFVLFFYYAATFLWFRVDAVHLQSRDDFIAGTFAGRVIGKRVVWTDHADLKHIWQGNDVWYKNPVGKLVLLAAGLAHTITVVSNSERKLVTEHLMRHKSIAKKIVVFYNGVSDRTDLVPQPDPEIFTFCMSGRVVIDKGVGEAVEAFRRFHKNHPKSQLVVIGDGQDRPTFQKQASDLPIVFAGHMDDPLSLAATAHVYLHPTYHEGFSVSLVEANMLGLPIIATAVGGNSEIVEDHSTGLLVPVKDASALYEAMELLYNDENLLKRLGQAARAQYESRFIFQHIVRDNFIPLYTKSRKDSSS